MFFSRIFSFFLLKKNTFYLIICEIIEWNATKEDNFASLRILKAFLPVNPIFQAPTSGQGARRRGGQMHLANYIKRVPPVSISNARARHTISIMYFQARHVPEDFFFQYYVHQPDAISSNLIY